MAWAAVAGAAVGVVGGALANSGGGGGGGSTTSTGTSSVPGYIQDAGQHMVVNGTAAANRAYQANPYLTQANWTPQQLQAQQMIQQQATQGNSTYQAANQNMTDTLNGKYLDPASNPYLQKSVDTALNDVQGRVGSQFAMGGAFGGSANQELLSRNLGQTANDMYSANYNNERQRQMQAATLAPQMQQAGYTDANALNTLGGQIQTYDQNNINNQSQAWQNEWNYPQQQQQYLANAISGAMGTGTKTSTQQTPYFTNPAANAMGLGLGAMNIYGAGQKAGIWGNNASNTGNGIWGSGLDSSGNVDMSQGSVAGG